MSKDDTIVDKANKIFGNPPAKANVQQTTSNVQPTIQIQPFQTRELLEQIIVSFPTESVQCNKKPSKE